MSAAASAAIIPRDEFNLVGGTFGPILENTPTWFWGFETGLG
jgi:hypothetical protein